MMLDDMVTFASSRIGSRSVVCLMPLSKLSTSAQRHNGQSSSKYPVYIFQTTALTSLGQGYEVDELYFTGEEKIITESFLGEFSRDARYWYPICDSNRYPVLAVLDAQHQAAGCILSV